MSPSRLTPARKWALALLLLGLFLALFYSDRVFSAGIYEGGDTLEHDIPLATFFVRSIRAGSFPLHNPHKILGVSFPESSFMGPYYPLVLLYFVLPAERAISIGFLAHLVLSGILFILLCRRLSFSVPVALLCGLCWTCCSVFLQYSRNEWLPETISAAYFPGLLLLIHSVAKAPPRGSPLPLLLGALAVALTITGGHPSYSLITLGSALIFLAPYILGSKNLRALLGVFLLGALLSIVSWGPLLLDLPQGPGITPSPEGYSARDLLHVISPCQDSLGFVGRLVLALGLVGFFLVPMRRLVGFRVLLILSPLLASALFWDSAPGRFLSQHTLLGQVQNVWVWHLGAITSLIVFAGAAMTRITDTLQRSPRGKVWALLTLCAVAVLQLGDLYCYGSALSPQGFHHRASSYFVPSPLLHRLAQDTSLFRLSNTIEDLPLFRKSQGTLMGIDTWEARVKGVNIQSALGRGALSYNFRERPKRRTMDLANIKYMVATQPPPGSGWRPAGTYPFAQDGHRQAATLYENSRAFPRAFLIHTGPGSATEGAMLQMRAPSLLALRIPDELYTALRDHSPVSTRRAINRYQLRTSSEKAGLLFLSEAHSRWWEARVDNEAAPVLSPLGLFLGLRIPAGAHTITFTYRPWPVYGSWAISLATLFGAVLWAWLRQKTRPPGARSRPPALAWHRSQAKKHGGPKVRSEFAGAAGPGGFASYCARSGSR